jgi:hypothetical protein
MKMNRHDIEEKLAKGLIRGYTETEKKYSTKSGATIPKARNKTKEWIALHLTAWAGARKLELKRELKFHPERKWKFDFAFPEKWIAIEYEGLMSAKSRHTTVTGYTGDAEKYNAAQQLGWKILRYTALNYKSMINDLNKLI